VRTPSPITMHVPSSTMMRRPTLSDLCFSRSFRTCSPRSVSGGSTTLYVDTSVSAVCWLRIKLSFAWRHSREYNANVPPAKEGEHDHEVSCDSKSVDAKDELEFR
jgi:hypothetical protein